MKWWVIAGIVGAAIAGVGYWWWENVAFCHYTEMREEAIRNGVIEPSIDTCCYALVVPDDMDLPDASPFDTTIVRDLECKRQLLRFPAWGTRSDYRVTGNGLERTIGFAFDQDSLQ